MRNLELPKMETPRFARGFATTSVQDASINPELRGCRNPLASSLLSGAVMGPEGLASKGATTMRARINKTRFNWTMVAAVVLTLVVAPATSRAEVSTAPPPTTQAEQHPGVVPDTSEQHLEKAKRYEEKAAAYREDADEHRKMLAEYKKRVALNPKDRLENPWLKKMRVHCEKYIKEAEALARAADEFAEYHRFRAAELRGE
jgi:hypothetical protein